MDEVTQPAGVAPVSALGLLERGGRLSRSLGQADFSLNCAVAVARELGHPALQARLQKLADELDVLVAGLQPAQLFQPQAPVV